MKNICLSTNSLINVIASDTLTESKLNERAALVFNFSLCATLSLFSGLVLVSEEYSSDESVR